MSEFRDLTHKLGVGGAVSERLEHKPMGDFRMLGEWIHYAHEAVQCLLSALERSESVRAEAYEAGVKAEREAIAAYYYARGPEGIAISRTIRTRGEETT